MDLKPPIPILHVSGSHYEVGWKIGNTFESNIRSYFNEFTVLRKTFLPLLETASGEKVYSNYLQIVKTTYPQYFDEIRGISEGSGIPFKEVFTMHIRTELQYMVDTKIVPECSTVFVNNKDCWALAHNEDTSEAVFGKGYLIVADIQEQKGEDEFRERFMAFCYPGIVPGNCFSMIAHGLVVTVNALYSQGMEPNGIPRQLVNRAMLAAKNPSQLLTILRSDDCGVGISTGCSVNMVHLKSSSDRVMCCYELLPRSGAKGTSVAKLDVFPSSTIHQPDSSDKCAVGHYVHFNSYLFTVVNEVNGLNVSSQHRKRVADRMPPPETIQDALDILGSTEDKQFPIFRRPNKTDIGCTVATGLFDLVKHKLLVYVGNPKFDNSPLLEVDFLT